MSGEKNVPSSETLGNDQSYLLDPPAENIFSIHLHWHLHINGTRPDGRPGIPGTIWFDADFVTAIDQARGKRGKQRDSHVRGDVAKNLRNWLNGRRCYPYWLNLIEKVLFGDNGSYSRWRAQLRQAHAANHKSVAENAIKPFERTVGISGNPLPANRNDLRMHEKTHAKLDAILFALGPQIELAKRQGITEAALRGIAARIESRMQAAPIEEIVRYVENFVTATLRMKKEINIPTAADIMQLALSGQPRNFSKKSLKEGRALRTRANKLISAGRFDEMSAEFDAVLLERRKQRATKAAEDRLQDIILLTDAAAYDALVYNFERAVRRYREAALLLSVDDENAQNGFLRGTASAYKEAGTVREETQLLLLAIEIFRDVANNVDRASRAKEWARAQRELGDALSELGEREGADQRLEEALGVLRGALQECDRKREPELWAAIHNDLGNALCRLGERKEHSKNLEGGIAAYQEALKEYTYERSRFNWATAHNNLGNALYRLGERNQDVSLTERATQAYREAIKGYSRQREPLQWAMVQNNLANALASIGETENGTERLDQAVSAYREALQEWTREVAPLSWAKAKGNLSGALFKLGQRSNDAKRMEEAISVCRDALRGLTVERVPFLWATLQKNLGSMLFDFGKQERSIERLKEALSAYREALRGMSKEDQECEMMNRYITIAENAVGEAFAEE